MKLYRGRLTDCIALNGDSTEAGQQGIFKHLYAKNSIVIQIVQTWAETCSGWVDLDMWKVGNRTEAVDTGQTVTYGQTAD